MFTVEQIKTAHSKVKTGADFPAYIQDLKKLGIAYYETFVSDGHTDYFGANDYKTTSPPKYDLLNIARTSDTEQFKSDLRAHQQGKSDYVTFCKIAARLGVERWAVDMSEMTCTYFDKAGNRMLVEEIPMPKKVD